jgi:preprotein translocase subunit SecY
LEKEDPVLSAFANAFRTPDLRRKLLFVLMIIAIFRLGSQIPTPGVNVANVQTCVDIASGGDNASLYSLVNMFSGGALLQLTVFALGIMPYITASIILQLLVVVIPRLEALKKEGQAGQTKITQYTRYLTLGLAVLQATGIVALARSGQLLQGCNVDLLHEVNQAGVIPVIFASSLLYLPAMLASFNQNSTSPWVQWINDYMVTGAHPLYMITFFLMIIFFTYFYVSITFNPQEVADNMKKYGGFIPGIRAGKPTEEYLSYVLSRITLPGSLYLGLVALIPLIAFALVGANQNFPFGGTSILIMVGVALDTVKQIESQLQQRNYEGFLR